MIARHEAEEIVRAATGGVLPEAGDALVWNGGRWVFIPAFPAITGDTLDPATATTADVAARLNILIVELTNHLRFGE